jgi:phospholipid/cholesterol/gamma-HCH transport system substrate-binding protein
MRGPGSCRALVRGSLQLWTFKVCPPVDGTASAAAEQHAQNNRLSDLPAVVSVVQSDLGCRTMQREIGRSRALLNAAFVLVVLAVAVFGVTEVSRRQWRVQRTFPVRARFDAIGGVEPGARVRVQGIDAGVVERVAPPGAPGEPVTLVFRIDARLRPLVRSDAVARIGTEGVVGAKVVEIVPGRPDAPVLADSGYVRSERPVELADLLRDARASLRRIDAVATAATEGLGEINAIAGAIRKGEGSLGKLVQDEEAYRKLVALSDRGERTLNDLEENLAALKRTWPLSRYFNNRAFFDRSRVLFHPGDVREGRTFREDQLFEPGRSVLTADGRRQLDSAGVWLKKTVRAKSEVVIAAFTDDAGDSELAQALTQEQADAVRKYLVAHHGIDSAGWFASRKVAAVGFGSETPRALPGDEPKDQPARRIEVILFTPQS